MSLRSYAAAPAKRSRRAPWLVVAVVVALGILALVVLGLALVPTQTRGPAAGRVVPSPTHTQLAATPPSPTRRAAIEAAVTALYSLAVPALTDTARFERSVGSLAARGREESVRRAFGAGNGDMRATLTDGMVRAAPLGYRVEEFDRHTASVSIWTVTLAVGRRLPPRASWRRLTIDLVWERGRWQVTGGAGGAAPSPSSSAGSVIAEEGTYAELRHAP